MVLAPTSSLNARNWGVEFVSYERYFQLPIAERQRRRAALTGLPQWLQSAATGPENYEAQQPPLAYLALTSLDLFAGETPLPHRIWVYRVACACASVVLFVFAMSALGSQMGIRPAYIAAAIFVLFSTQSLFGAIAHVANDWLSLPLIPLVLLAAAKFWNQPDRRSCVLLAAALATGLLTKSYFLVFVPPVAVLVSWRSGPRMTALWLGILAVVAGPWYLRNVLLYGNLTGLQSAVRAIPGRAVLHMFLTIPWHTALPAMARGGLWTANNSFAAFSKATLNIVLLLLSAGGALWALRWRTLPNHPAHGIVAAGTLVFAAIPIYAMALFGAVRGEAHANANSWYSAGLLPCVLLIAFSGCAQGGVAGRVVAIALIAVSCYIVAATYFARLIPLYAGYDAPGRIGWLVDLYTNQWRELLSRLGETALASGEIVAILALAVALISAAVGWRISRNLLLS